MFLNFHSMFRIWCKNMNTMKLQTKKNKLFDTTFIIRGIMFASFRLVSSFTSNFPNEGNTRLKIQIPGEQRNNIQF